MIIDNIDIICLVFVCVSMDISILIYFRRSKDKKDNVECVKIRYVCLLI